MISSTELKNGVAFIHYGKPFQVVKYSLIKMGRGGAVVKVMARNLEDGSNQEISFSSNVNVDEANTTKRSLQYLYKDQTNAVFMDPRSFEQIEIPLEVLGDQILFVKEGAESVVLFWEDKALSVDIPPKVILAVKETDPGIKGNSASNFMKSATLENGLNIKVPLFIKEGEKIKVDTRTWQYIERAK
ncbi:MAG TPA: elongation factor P [Alphaproteobacteria bacterium]|jgi:elongation factor P|nr:elongation factor P [Alphaproteobacteria bacterium]